MFQEAGVDPSPYVGRQGFNQALDILFGFIEHDLEWQGLIELLDNAYLLQYMGQTGCYEVSSLADHAIVVENINCLKYLLEKFPMSKMDYMKLAVRASRYENPEIVQLINNYHKVDWDNILEEEFNYARYLGCGSIVRAAFEGRYPYVLGFILSAEYGWDYHDDLAALIDSWDTQIRKEIDDALSIAHEFYESLEKDPETLTEAQVGKLLKVFNILNKWYFQIMPKIIRTAESAKQDVDLWSILWGKISIKIRNSNSKDNMNDAYEAMTSMEGDYSGMMSLRYPNFTEFRNFFLESAKRVKELEARQTNYFE